MFSILIGENIFTMMQSLAVQTIIIIITLTTTKIKQCVHYRKKKKKTRAMKYDAIFRPRELKVVAELI
jgi:hypothetical protein